MPNFDLFERILINCLVGAVTSEEAASQIYSLPEKQKVQLVKNKNKDGILSFLNRCTGALHSRFPEDANFESSNNNMIGNDIYESTTKRHIEIKSGHQMTDANCGLSVVSWALNDEHGFIKNNMTEGMKNRKDIFLSGGSDKEIDLDKSRQMDALSNFLTQQTQNIAESKLSHFFKSTSRGITKGNVIIENYNEGRGSINFPLKLMCDWEIGLVEYDKSFDCFETLLIDDVGKTNQRCRLSVIGEQSGVQAQLYPHYKNSLNLGNGQKIPANCWVKTPCFHVWIKGPND